MTARYLVGDVFDRLAEIPDGSVDLVITSPPFLALRSYLPVDHPDKGKEIGSEATPAAFLDVMLAVMAELRRVTAEHGSVCIELGDTYAGSGGAGGDYAPDGLRDGQPKFRQMPPSQAWRFHDDGTIKTTTEKRLAEGKNEGHVTPMPAGPGWPLGKSRALIPELFRVALAYGINPLTGQPSPAGKWLVRNVVTWCRPNPPVGALGDKWRPATSDVVVACTSPKRYWDDLATRKLGVTENGRARGPKTGGAFEDHRDTLGDYEANPSGAPLLDYWEVPLLEGEEPRQYGPTLPKPKGMTRHREGEPPRTDLPSQQRDGNWRTLPQTNDDPNGPGAPLLDYWEIPPTGYKGSHYAVYPPALVEPLVKAMCPEKVCKTCGEPRRRITETTNAVGKAVGRRTWMNGTDGIGAGHIGEIDVQANHSSIPDNSEKVTLGWTDCGHDNYRPGLILDPFAGSGTTLLVATGHGHDAIGIDLDSRNAELAMDRVGPFLMEVEA